MLKIHPNCEFCDKDLPPDSTSARICSYECTYCADCVETVLSNVCPNCGGGFTPRPIRPRNAHRPGVGLAHQPAATERKHQARSRSEIEIFALDLKDVPPEMR